MEPEQRLDTDRTRPNTDPTVDHLTVAEASARLGLTTDAVRMRVRRGTLPSVEVDGRRWVLVKRSDTDATRPNADQTSTEHHDEQPLEQPNASELIVQLRSEVSYLRQTLDAEIEARRRSDHLVAGMIEERRSLMSQIAELQSGATEHEAEHRPNDDRTTEKTEYAPVDSQEGPGRIDPPEMTSRTLLEARDVPAPAQAAQATGWRRWWRRVMGQEG